METVCNNEQTKQVGLFFLLLNLLIVFLTSIYKVIINFTFSSFIAGYLLQPFAKKEQIIQWYNYLYDKCNNYFTYLYEKIPLQYKKQYVKEEDLKHTISEQRLHEQYEEQHEMKEINNKTEVPTETDSGEVSDE